MSAVMERTKSVQESPESAEQARLRAENRLLRSLVEISADIVTVLDVEGRIVTAFRSRDRQLGYEPGEVEGRHFEQLLHPDERIELLEVFAELLKQPGAEVSRQMRLGARDGTYAQFECVACNRFDDPNIGGLIVHCRDVSERRELERRLQLAQRMESVGRLASGVAHDFNNILAVIQLTVSRALQARGELNRHLLQIQSTAERASTLTKRLLSFAREKPPPPSITNVSRLVEGMAETLRGLLPEAVKLEVSVAEGACYVLADPVELEQAILNLVLNARDAVTAGGEVWVAVSQVPVDDAHLAGGGVMLVVEDDGVGMDAATQKSALEPFFTTKEMSNGTGLGLWTVSDFVSRSAGTIRVVSTLGKGSRLELRLPAASTHGRARSTVPPVPAANARKVTVLLAEDERALRVTVAELLRDGGHEVIVAADGEQALSIVEARSEPIDLLVTDVIMPRLGGLELATALREQNPELAVLFMTGYGETRAVQEALPGSTLLRKPFAAQALGDAILRLLA